MSLRSVSLLVSLLASAGCAVVLGIEPREERSCEGGTVRCVETARFVCAADGSVEVEDPCGPSEICAGDGECVAVACVEPDGTVLEDDAPLDCSARVCRGHAVVHEPDASDVDACSRCQDGAPVPVVAALARGLAVNHACARTCDGRVACWGSNTSSQLGVEPSVTLRSDARWVELPARAVDLVTGFAHTCATLEDGRVFCFGNNADGQINPAQPSAREPTPVEVPALAGTTALTAGSFHTCGAFEDGEVRCFGKNDYGQLGDGTTLPHSDVVTVPALGPSPIRRLAAGTRHTCALHEDGSLACWGESNSMGNGAMGTGPAAPGPVTITEVVAVAAGDLHTCAVRSSGEVACFGGNGNGQSGTVTFPDNAWVPETVAFSVGALRVSGGFRHSCASNATATWCWGADGNAELGDIPCPDPDGCPGAIHVEPVLAQIPPASDLTTPWAHTCALVDGFVWCWGANDTGQLGLGSVDKVVAAPGPILWPPADP